MGRTINRLALGWPVEKALTTKIKVVGDRKTETAINTAT
jgi:hypothetical protein